MYRKLCIKGFITIRMLSDIDYSNCKCLIIHFRCRLRTSAVLLVSWVLPPCWKACERVILLWSMDPEPMQVQKVFIRENILLTCYNHWVIKHIIELRVSKCISFCCASQECESNITKVDANSFHANLLDRCTCINRCMSIFVFAVCNY